MLKINVTFSDGSSQIFIENQCFKTYFFKEMKGWTPPSFETIDGSMFTLSKKRSPNLVQNFLEILANSNFFFDVEKPDTIYNSQSIIKIEVLD